MEERPRVKGPAIVKLAGWIILGFSLAGLNPVGIVAGIVLLKYADRIAGKVAGKTAWKAALKAAGTAKPPAIGEAAGARTDRGFQGRDVAEEARGEREVMVTCPFCRKMNQPNTGKCRYCGYAM